MQRSNRPRPAGANARGFTLVELLVVITIIGVLIGLLLPAVQAAREAGRKAQCANNIRNLSLAMLNFETSKKHFPGYLNAINLGVNSSGQTVLGPVSWVTVLLPYIEKSDLYEAYEDGLKAGSLTQVTNAATIAILTCPTDPPESAGPNLAYVVNRGRNHWNNNATLGVCFDLINPAATQHSKVSVDYIGSHDGTSNTLLIAESLLTPSGATLTGSTPPTMTHLGLYSAEEINPVSPDGELYYYRPTSSWLPPTGGWVATNYPTTLDTTSELILGFEWSALGVVSPSKVTNQLNSRHAGNVISVGFCDHHQQWLRADIDPNVFRHIMTPYGKGVPATLTDWPATTRGVLNEGDL